MTETIVLASASPRRRQILKQMNLPFIVKPVDIEEKLFPGSVISQTERLAYKKIDAYISENKNREEKWVLTADTLIEIDRNPFGKPETRKDAEKMLKRLSENTHRVITALALYNRSTGEIICRNSITRVEFARLNNREIEDYLNTGEWDGAAGAYMIQGRGSILINEIKGSYSNVMGLPIRLFYEMLTDQNYFQY